MLILHTGLKIEYILSIEISCLVQQIENTEQKKVNVGLNFFPLVSVTNRYCDLRLQPIIIFIINYSFGL